jgi:AraC-like DNA-binding protein
LGKGNKISNQIKEYSFREEVDHVGFEIITLDAFRKSRVDEGGFNPHRINFNILLFITEGLGEHIVDFKSYNYQRGSVLLIGQNQTHSWVKNENASGFLLLFTEQFLIKNQINLLSTSFTNGYYRALYKPVIQLQEQGFDSYLRLIDLIFEEFQNTNLLIKTEILQNLLRTALLKLQSYSSKEFKEVDYEVMSLFIRFQRVLEQNISNTRNAKDYCDLLNVSYRKLNESSVALTNKTVKSFIDSFILLEAKRLLSIGENNISEIADKLGFSEGTNFTKFFKKYTEFTPKQFVETINKR